MQNIREEKRQFKAISSKPIFILYSRITLNLVKSDGWWPFSRHQKHLGVSIGSLLLSKGGNHIDKAPVVLDATLGTASLLLFLLLLVNLEDDRRDQLVCIIQRQS